MQTIITVEEEKMCEELSKFHLRGLPFDAVIHKFSGVDVGDPHDHPFGFTSFILKGGYVEERYWLTNRGHLQAMTRLHRCVGASFKTYASTVHQIIELSEGECWTLILPEKWERKPGFYKFGNEVLHRFWDEEEFKPLSKMLSL